MRLPLSKSPQYTPHYLSTPEPEREGWQVIDLSLYERCAAAYEECREQERLSVIWTDSSGYKREHRWSAYATQRYMWLELHESSWDESGKIVDDTITIIARKLLPLTAPY